MKKLLSFTAALALCAFGAVAEAAATPLPAATRPLVAATRQPEVFSESDAPYDGVWQPFEDGFRLYLPRGWVRQEIDAAQAEAGLFYRAGSDDGEMGIAVGYMSAGGLETTDELARDFASAGYSAVTRLNRSGIPAIGFERPQDGYRGVAFFHPVYPDYVLYVYALPLAPRSAEARRTLDALMASIGPIPGFAGQVKK